MFGRRKYLRGLVIFLWAMCGWLAATPAVADPTTPAALSTTSQEPKTPTSATAFKLPGPQGAVAAETSPAVEPSPDDATPAVSRAWNADASRRAAPVSAKSPASAGEYVQDVELGMIVPLWSAIPFLGLVLSLALVPALSREFWRRQHRKFVAFWALAFVVPFTIAFGELAWREIANILLFTYLPFIVFLGSLYAVAGGLIVRGAWRGRPWSNALLLLLGAALAPVIGAAGAAMLLIRPFLRANAHRQRKTHLIVFFIFLVGNIGASPLGSGPLLIGYLAGVPFWWSLALLPQCLATTAILLALFLAIDMRLAAREKADPPAAEPLRIHGWFHLLFFAGIVAALIVPGKLAWGSATIFGLRLAWSSLLRDVLILLMGALSAATTPAAQRAESRFSWEPLTRTAILFAGIFVTIIPGLAILRAGEDGALGDLMVRVCEPWHYFVLAGGLAAFLNNVPAYLALLTSQLSVFYPTLQQNEAVARLLTDHRIYLVAVAAGSTILGALTYVGNAPTYLIHAIAEENGVKMPSFLGYLFLWSAPILLPIFAFLTWAFYLR
jgi:Na+/H+ antiporter NhaD/arsenite permease-like protein